MELVFVSLISVLIAVQSVDGNGLQIDDINDWRWRLRSLDGSICGRSLADAERNQYERDEESSQTDRQQYSSK